MNDINQLKLYAELFKKKLNPFLAPGVSIRTTIYPVQSEGAVFEFILNKSSDDAEIVDAERSTVGKVLLDIPQRIVGGNIDAVWFRGTNLSLEGNRVLLIKGEDDPNSWSTESVIEDVKRVVSTSQEGRLK